MTTQPRAELHDDDEITIMNTASPATLPPVAEISSEGPTVSDHYNLLGRDDQQIAIRGALIGFGSSEREEHGHSTNGSWPYVQAGQRCSACRWFEIRIFVVENEITGECNCGADLDFTNGQHEPNCGLEPPRARYLVLTYGRTIVQGESNKRRASWTDSPYEVIELLTQRNGNSAFLPSTSARALAQAAHYDSGIHEAYINRAVV